MKFALDAWIRLVDHVCGSGTGSNMNLLLSFTARAFHGHNNVPPVGHGWDLVLTLPRMTTMA